MTTAYGIGSVLRSVLTAFFILGSLLIASAPVEAASTCSDCHGMPPLDALFRNVTTGGFRGSHQTHQPVVATPANCSICHSGSNNYTEDHKNEIIELSSNINSSPAAALYSKGVFFNQTSIPVMGTCSNVNCHFESVTPAWAATPLTSPAGCSTCHGAPPSDGNHPGISGAGKKHGDYYGTGTGSCVKCHIDHTTEAKPFAHATSAGKRGLIIVFNAFPNSGGSYSGNVSYPGYLPSQNPQRNGTCSALYCHSNSGPNATVKTYAAVIWGAAMTCAGCHADMSTVASTAPNGGHYVHASTTNSTGPKLACTICHAGYTATTSNTATHVNQQVELTFAATATTTYTKTSPMPAGGAFGTCSASKCHGSASSLAWGGTIYKSGTDDCSTCHASTVAGAVTVAVPFYSTSYPTKVTASTDTKVGAHTSHVVAVDSLSNSVACVDCHGSVTFATTTHMNGTTDFVWSALAKTGGLTPIYTANTGVCTNVYCHGAKMSGGDTSGTNRAPTWNNTTYLPASISAAACGTCHGFPPATTSGHPAVTIPTGFPATATIGTTCSCHANINSAGNSYANIFVNKALHIDGVLQVSGGHAVPYDTHKADVVAAGGNTACLGCHAMGTATSPYPAAVVGNPPDCMSCHIKAAPLHSGTAAGANCSSCHGLSTATGAKIGRPVGTAYPDRLGYHSGASDSAHGTAACTVCHSGAGTTSGNNSGINHGKGSTAGPVRDGKPNVVGPMVNGITPTNSAKGVGTPANGTTCVHGTISSGCSGGGTKTSRW